MIEIFKNTRLKYNFVKRLAQLVLIDEKVFKYKLIASNNYRCETKNELRIKNISDAYDYLVNSLKQPLTKELLKTAYYIITKETTKAKLFDEIVDYYYLNVDEAICCLSADIYYQIKKSTIKRKVEFGMLVASYLLMRQKAFPLIILKNDYYQYKRAIKDFGENKLEWQSLVYQIEHRTRKMYEVSNRLVISRGQIVKTLLKHQDILESEFKVRHLYLFGSIATNKSHNGSDIDLRVTFDPRWEASKIKLINNLSDMLYQLLRVKVDLVETNEGLNSYLKYDYDKHIKIY